MKKPIKTLLIGISTMLLVALLSSTVWAIAIEFQPSASDIYVGDSIDVDIAISGLQNDNLSGFDIFLNFDSSVLAFNSYIFGDQLGAPVGPIGSFLPAEDWSPPYIGGDTLHLAEVSWLMDFSFQADSFILATVSFTAIGAGTSDLSLPNVFLSDDSWLPAALNATLETGSVNVAPVPEPTTVLLLGTGLLGLAGTARRKLKK